MSAPTSVLQAKDTKPDPLRPAAKPNPVRPTAKFHPNIWGDLFLNYNYDDMIADNALTEKKVKELKEVVRQEIFESSTHGISYKLKLIDAIQRLGLAYHFEREIQESLQNIYAVDYYNIDEDLYTTSLYFRLLRQEGYNVSCEIFNKFKEGQGSFKSCLVADNVGMLSLYEATHLRCQEEATLEEALVFVTTHLESMVNNSDNPLAGQIKSALKRPLRKSLERLHARYYISVYQNEESHNICLLQLAKLDFNLLQSQHKKQLSEISKWWKKLDFARKLTFARDRIVELYFWILGVYFEPQYELARGILTKCIAMVSFMDDIYDAFGTLEELTVLTEVIERWDINLIGQLPEYMQIFYQALHNVFDEFEEEMIKENKSHRVFYAKEAMKIQARSYFEEAIWLKEGHIPSMEEYLRVSLVSTGYSCLSLTSLIGILDDNIITKNVFESILFRDPKIIKASSIICRLMDDSVSHKFEQEREHVASGIECYMKQHAGVTEEEVKQVFMKKIENAWKEINEEMLLRTSTELPMLVKIRVLNLSRVIDLLYTEDDGYTRVGKVMRDNVTNLLINPLPL